MWGSVWGGKMRGMKKILAKMLLGALGLSAVLTSCGGDATTDTGDAAIYSDSLQLVSGYRMGSQNVICDNVTTPMQFTFSYSGNLHSVRLLLRGVTTGEITNLPNPDDNNTVLSDGRGVVTFYATSASVPLSLPSKATTQAIVVTPKQVENAHVIGYTKVQMQGVDNYGGTTGYVSSNSLPVIDNCY